MDDYIGNFCCGFSGSNSECSSYLSYPVKLQPKLICSAAPNAKAKQVEKKGVHGKNNVPPASYEPPPTPKAAAARKKQEVVKVNGCSKGKNVTNPTKSKTKVSALVMKKQAKGSKVGVVASYTSTTKSKMVVSVEKEEYVKVVAGFLKF